MAATPEGKAYAGPEVTVYFNAQRCLHAAECLRGLPSVFDAKARPWIRADGAPAEQVAEVVRRCPSGALHYVLADGPAEAPESPTSLRPEEGGPLFVRGDLRFEAAGGSDVVETRAALCVCARSENAPFCDNACKRD